MKTLEKAMEIVNEFIAGAVVKDVIVSVEQGAVETETTIMDELGRAWKERTPGKVQTLTLHVTKEPAEVQPGTCDREALMSSENAGKVVCLLNGLNDKDLEEMAAYADALWCSQKGKRVARGRGE